MSFLCSGLQHKVHVTHISIHSHLLFRSFVNPRMHNFCKLSRHRQLFCRDLFDTVTEHLWRVLEFVTCTKDMPLCIIDLCLCLQPSCSVVTKDAVWFCFYLFVPLYNQNCPRFSSLETSAMLLKLWHNVLNGLSSWSVTLLMPWPRR